MVCYNLFFEKVGFKFFWEIVSGRFVFFYFLIEEVKEYIECFFKEDLYVLKDGRFWCLSYGKVEFFSGLIVFKDVSKVFESEFDVKGFLDEIREFLEVFGVRYCVI